VESHLRFEVVLDTNSRLIPEKKGRRLDQQDQEKPQQIEPEVFTHGEQPLGLSGRGRNRIGHRAGVDPEAETAIGPGSPGRKRLRQFRARRDRRGSALHQ